MTNDVVVNDRREQIAAVLAVHFLISRPSMLRGDELRGRCSCGWQGERMGQASTTEYRAHVAEVLDAALTEADRV